MLYVNPQLNRYVFKKLYRPFSRKFPYPRKDFIGRNKDVIRVVELIDFSNTSQPEIICIIGPPGIGKSSLAIYIGDEMIVNGATVHYVDMAEFPDGQLKQVLAERLLYSKASGNINVTYDGLLGWAHVQHWKSLIVLDNCDECINSQKQAFQEAIGDILDHSNIRFLITSREETMFIEPYHVYKLQPLSEDSACELLEQKIPLVLNETEKKQIAELTGEMPLALQVIGSLLNIKIAPPTPQQIIARLKKNPIPTLSPPKLARSLQLNFSIGLSYNYLDSKLQKIGRFLALFPGSFDATAAINVLMFISNSSRSPVEDLEYFTNSLNELVARSLLELDEYTGRFNFHRLIKEFFLLHSKKSENNRFKRAFQDYFSVLLCKLTTLYYDRSPLKALASLERERHNLLHFMTNINDPLVYYDQALSIYNTSLTCFNSALNSNFLSIRFLPKELISPVRSITTILGVELLKGRMKRTNFFSHFVNFIYHLSSLTELVKGRDQAINEFKKRVDAIEYLDNPDSNEQYILFYERFLKYELELGEDKAKLYFERILKKARGLTCKYGCDYKTMANSYNHLGKYETSAKFYEKALEEEHHNAAVKVFMLMETRYMYGVLQDTNKRYEANEKLLNMFPLLINMTSSSVYANMYTFQRYMTFLRQTKESNKTKAISEKMIESLSELGKGDIGIINIAYTLAEEHYDHKEFRRAAKIASNILDSLQGLDGSQQQFMSKENVSIHMILGKSAYHSGNYSEAKRLFMSIIDSLLVSNQMDENFATCCSYLTYMGNLEYIHDCYSSVYNTAFQKVETCVQIFVSSVFIIIPFDDHEPKTMHAPSDLPVEMYPQVIQRSKSKTVLFNANKDLSLPHQDLPPFPFHSPAPSTYDIIVNIVKKIFNEAIKYQLICIFINWLLVFIRLWLVYYFIRLILFIFRCIFRCISKFWSSIKLVFIIMYLSVICGLDE